MDFRTDLALERRDIYKKANKIEDEIQGVETEENVDGDIKVSKVKIIDKRGEEALGKPARNIRNNRYKKFKSSGRSRHWKSGN